MQIRIDGWRSGIRFDSAHIIPHHPKCGHLHGHTYALHAVLEGAVGESGFITDFGHVKAALKTVADRLDHQVLVQAKSPDFDVVESEAEVSFTIGQKRYALPGVDVELLPIEYTSAEELAAYVLDVVLDEVELPENVTALEVGVDESYGKGAWARAELE